MITESLIFNEENILKLEADYFPSYGSAKQDKKNFQYLVWRLFNADCKHILIEKNYVDRDFGEDYSTFYSTVFQDRGKRCTRLHFFTYIGQSIESLLFGKSRVMSLKKNKKNNLNKVQNAYLGFIVILPISKGKLGRTVIRPKINIERTCFCTAKTVSKVNIEGIPLLAHGAPFMQQDGQVSVCSTTAIWMVARYMHLKYNFSKYSLSDITIAANKYLRINREFPAIRGLTIEQIVSAFSELGFTPICYQKFTFQDAWNPKEIIYKYVESGLPVIAIIGGKHSCVIIGHDYNSNKKISSNSNLISNSEFIGSYIVHDDLLGPYLFMLESTLPVAGSDKWEFTHSFNPFRETPILITPYTMKSITSIIIPTFKKVYLEGQQIEDLVRNIFEDKDSMYLDVYLNTINMHLDLFSQITRSYVENFNAILKNKKNIFYRTRFVLSSLFKEDYLLKKK